MNSLYKLATAVASLYTSRACEHRRRAHRLAVQDVALSRQKQGFESPWARQGDRYRRCSGVLNAIDDLAANMAGDRTYYHAQPLGWLGEF